MSAPSRATSRSSKGCDDAGDLLALLVALAGDHDDVAGPRAARSRSRSPSARSRSISTSVPAPCRIVLDDRERILRARVVVRDDHAVGELSRDASHLGPLRRSRSPPAPKTTVSRPAPSVARGAQAPPRARPACGSSRRRPRTSCPSSIDSKRPGTPVTASNALGDRVLVDVEQQRGGDGAEHVLDVEHAREAASRSRSPPP